MSCLFRSLASFISNVDENGLRQMICNYLSQDPLIMGERFSVWIRTLDAASVMMSSTWSIPSCTENCRSIEQYVGHMRQPSTWGGAFEIHVFCELFRARVIVFSTQHPHAKPIEFIPESTQPARRSLYFGGGHVSDELPTLRISYTGNHYEPIL